MKTVRWGIIGCGSVCEVKSGPAFYKCENSSLQAVMRRDEEKVKNFARRHNVKHWYTDAESLINDPEVDAVYIATPPVLHEKYAILALEAGKPVYVEKPMAISYAECQRMNEAARMNRQKLWVAFYRRGLPYFLQVKKIIDSGVLGKLQTANVQYLRPPGTHDLDPKLLTWRVDKKIAGGGYFYDLAPHTIDILHFLLGKFATVKGITANIGGLYPVEDAISASYLFESGVVGSGIWCYVSSPLARRDSIEICGEKGMVRFSTFAFTPIELITGSGTETFDLPAPPHIQQPLIQSIVDEILGKGVCPSTGESAAHTNWVIDQIFGN